MQGRQTHSDSVGMNRAEEPQQPNQKSQSESSSSERATRPLVDVTGQKQNQQTRLIQFPATSAEEGGGQLSRPLATSLPASEPESVPKNLSRNLNDNGQEQTRRPLQVFNPEQAPQPIKGPLRTQQLRRDYQPEQPPQRIQNSGQMPSLTPPEQYKQTIIQPLKTQPLRRDQPGVNYGSQTPQNGTNGAGGQAGNPGQVPVPPPAPPVVKSVQTQPLRGKYPVEEKPKPPVVQTLKTQPLRREMLDNLQLPKRPTGIQPGAESPQLPPPPVIGNRTKLGIDKAIDDAINSKVKMGKADIRDLQPIQNDKASKRTISSTLRSVVGSVSKSKQPISLSLNKSSSETDFAPTTAAESGSLKKKAGDAGELYSQLLERCSLKFERPEFRLRFINNMLAGQMERQKRLQQSLRYFQFLENTRLSKLYSRLYTWVLEGRFYNAVLEETRSLLLSPEQHGRFSNPLNIELPFAARLFTVLYQTRRALYAAGVLMGAVMVVGLYFFASWSVGQIGDHYTRNIKRPLVVVPQKSDSATNVDYNKLKEVFKVNSGDKDEEWYSNGCRINVTSITRNRPRGYYLIPRGGNSSGETEMHEPVGILYHTSESDIVKFDEDNVDQIERSSKGVLGWIIRKKSYNYFIDRIGKIYRVVPDDQAANHAGNSIWGDDKNLFVGLNDSFIGVCFESTIVQGKPEEALTDAQIDAGRILTAMLRYKYKISDANSTAHGLVSINPDKMLIAHHYDWVRGFPFNSMGLSDKYQVMPAYMSDYGFTYDDSTLQKLGNQLWEGAVLAEEEFKRRADSKGVDPDTFRRQQRARYYDQYNKASHLRAETVHKNPSNLGIKLPNR